MFGRRTLRRIVRVRKRPSEYGLERVEREALALQLSRYALCPATLQCHALGPLPLRRQTTDTRLDRLCGHAVAFEQVPDRFVAEATIGKCRRSRRSEAPVVDVADALERVERVGTIVVVDACPLEAIVDLTTRPVAMLERARGQIDRVGRRLRR